MKNINPIARLTLLTFCFVLSFLSSNGQVIQEVQNSFNLYKQTALQEKIFVHTDKTTYLPGEIVWFKIYCVDGNDHKPLTLSKVVYAEILDNNQNPVAQAKIAINNGIGDGSLYIPVTVNNGNYKFRAYTSWMKNFSPDYYFEKIITLVNPLKSPNIGANANTAKSDVQFFPEGGNLVNGITSKVAFKVTGPDGKGRAATGVIVSEHNDTIAKLQSLKFGMGNFLFTPAAGTTYKAIVNVGGSRMTVSLPKAESQGYVMNLSDKGADLDISVKGPDGNVYLFAHTRKEMKAAEAAYVSNGSTHFIVKKASLSDGISAITIFNGAKQPVCERLYFKRPEHKLLITASSDQKQYGKRKKVNIDVDVKNKNGIAVATNMSMAVYRVDSLQNIDRTNIFDYLWLGSDLKGGIESPEYYFDNVTAESDEALDNLMLTQGWRRFQWNDLLENKTPEFTYLPEYRGHIITGKIVNTQTGAPAKDIITYIAVPGKRVQVYVSQSDSSGHVFYSMKQFYGPGELIAQTNQNIDSTYRIDIASPFSEQYSKTSLPKFDFIDSMRSALQEHSLGVQVLNIYTGNDIKRYYNPHVDSTGFFGKPYKTYKLDDFTRFTTMEEDLREYVSEDNIVKSKGRFHIKVLNDRGFLDGDPLVLLDGVPVFDVNKIFNVDPLKVKKLDVVRERYFYGPSEDEGIFSFVTYKGDLGGVDLDPHAVVIDYEGLQLRREFYSPVYDTETQAASRIPDFRNLLYWAPTVSKDGKMSFFTSDLPGKYVGVVQGLTNNGEAGSGYFTFDVR
ncbi:MAG TPA: MG2 domain-containing protein [Mucilaginibacter sp.]|nr:MG2 domain-containing protein [Mucilaginibacter sp.]